MSHPADQPMPVKKTIRISRNYKCTGTSNNTPEVTVQTDGKQKFVIIDGKRTNVGNDIPEGAKFKITTKRKILKRKKIIPRYHDVKYEVELGRRVAVKQVEAPLSNFWHRVNEVRDFLVFFVNLAFAAYDLLSDPRTDLTYKAASFAFGIGEVFIVIGIWMLTVCCAEKMSSKKAQYIENFVMEILLFIAIILTLYGLVVGKDYMISDSVQILAMALLIIDIADLILLYGIRLIFVKKLTDGLSNVLQKEDPNFDFTASGGFRPGIVLRAYLTIVGNSLVFALLLFVLALQVHQDNHISQDYTCNFRQVWLILMTLFIPISSLGVFVLVNLHWVMEYCIRLSLVSADIVKQIREEDENEELADIIETNITTQKQGIGENENDKIEERQNRLEELQEVTTREKFLYATREIWIMLLLLLWFLLLLTIPITLDTTGEHIHTNTVALSLVSYFIVVFLANWQAVAMIFAFIPLKIYQLTHSDDNSIIQVNPSNVEGKNGNTLSTNHSRVNPLKIDRHAGSTGATTRRFF